MAKKFLEPLDLTQLEILNVRLQQLSSAPGSPVEGQIWHNTTNHRPQWRSNTANNDIYPFDTANTNNTGVLRDGSGNFSAGTITAALTGTASQATTLDDGTVTYRSGSYYLARANHTGTQLASTISNFDTQVRTSRLDQMAVPTATVSFNSQLVSNVLDPVSPQDAATKAYVDAVATGLDIKGSVRVTSAAALPAYSRTGSVITASANGALAAVDGVTLVANDRLLLKNGASNVDNGIYVVTQVGTGGTPFVLTRSTDADSSAEVTAGMFCFVEEGSTLADTGWVLTTNNPIVLNTTALTFTQFSGAGTYIGSSSITISGATISINATYVGQTSLTTLGTVTTGTWQATAVAAQYGGTGINGSTAANGTLLIGNGSGYTLATLTQGTNMLITNGSGTITIATASTVLTGTLVSGRVPFANGTQSLTDSSLFTFSVTTGLTAKLGSGASSTAFGTNAMNTSTTSTASSAFGANALAGLLAGGPNDAFGQSALTSVTGGSRNAGFGNSAGSSFVNATDNTAIGYNALGSATGNFNTAIGANAAQSLTSGTANIFIGSTAGDSTANGTSGHFVAGSVGAPITDVYFGNGEKTSSASGVIIHSTAGSGTDIAGSSLTLAPGVGTGTGVGGSLIFQTSPVGTTSATPNTLITRLTIFGDGASGWTGIATTSAPAVSTANNGRIYYDSTTQAFMVSTNTGAYATMSVGGIGGSLVAGRITLSNGTSSVTDSATFTYTATAGLVLAPTAVATGVQTAVRVTGAANTNMTLSTEVIDANFALNRTVQWATGALATQRAFAIQAPTYAFVGASTITNAATFAVTGAPVAGTNATLTNSYAVWVQGGVSRFDGNISLNDAVNVVIGTTTGTKFGTATTQKIGFYNATPIVQPSGDVITALTNLGLVATPTISATTLTGIVPSTSGGTGVNNAGTITNASNTTITGGGTLALGGFTLTVPATGTATLGTGTAGQVALWGGTNTVQGSTTFTYTATTGLTIAPTAVASGTQTAFTLTTAANTNQTASTEAVSVNFNLVNTVQFATGALSTQRAVVISAPTYAFVGASTITRAATFAIGGAPLAGTNATITNAYSLWVQGGKTQLDNGLAVDGASSIVFTQQTTGVGNGTSRVFATWTGAAWTGSTASTEQLDMDFALNRTVQFATGALTTQRAFLIRAPTYGFVGASTITNAATFAISGAPVAGTNATLTNTWALWVQGGTSRFDGQVNITTSVSPLLITQGVATTGSPTALSLTGGAHTTLTLSVEAIDVNLALNRTVQFATGALTTQRAVLVQAPTYAFVAASTITNAATFAISGAPAAGANATLTNTYALWVQGGISRFDGNLSINDAVNVVLGTTTGTQIGTSTSQKLGFFAATPVAQQTGNISTALANLGLVTSGTLPYASLTSIPAATASGLTMSTARLLGRTTASTGAIEEISIGSGLTLSGGVLAATGSGTVAKFATSIGNGALTTFTVTHSLGTLDVVVTVYDNGTGEEVITDVIHATTNTLTVNFAVAPTTNQYRVVVAG